MELLNLVKVIRPALTVSIATNVGPEGQWKLAGGEAQRNHRNPPDNGFRPGGGGGIVPVSCAPPGRVAFCFEIRWLAPPANFRPPSGREGAPQ